jgi:hypothetical protein
LTEKDGVKGIFNISIPFTGRYTLIAVCTGSMTSKDLKIKKTFYKEKLKGN